MSATQEIKSKKLGIIAGGGSLPAKLVSSCQNKNIEPFIIGFEGQTSVDIMDGHNHSWVGLGSVGKIIKYFKSNGVTDLVLIGSIKRPSFSKIKLDFRAVKMLASMALKSMGDNQVLDRIKTELELEGFTLHGIQEFCDEVIVGEGLLGGASPTAEDCSNIELGIKASQLIGAMDIGQSVIVQNGMVVGVEAVEGTDALIERCTLLLQKGGRGILVKSCKPQQDKNLDLPTIGENTVINAYKAGLSGIAVHANNVIITDLDAVVKLADKHGIFIIGINID